MNCAPLHTSIVEETMEELLAAGVGETEFFETKGITLYLDVDQLVAELQLGVWDHRIGPALGSD
jgi:hypothetical protein